MSTEVSGISATTATVTVGGTTLPAQVDDPGSYLTTDGTTLSWAVPEGVTPGPLASWARAFRSTTNVDDDLSIRDVAEARDGSIFVCGQIVTQPSGPLTKAFLAKLDSRGVLLWLRINSTSRSVFDRVDVDSRGRAHLLGRRGSAAINERATYTQFDADGTLITAKSWTASGYTFTSEGDLAISSDDEAVVSIPWSNGGSAGTTILGWARDNTARLVREIAGADRVRIAFYPDGYLAAVAYDNTNTETTIYSINPATGNTNEDNCITGEILGVAVDHASRLYLTDATGVFRVFDNTGSELRSVGNFANDSSEMTPALEATGGAWRITNDLSTPIVVTRINQSGTPIVTRSVTWAADDYYDSTVAPVAPRIATARTGQVIVGFSQEIMGGTGETNGILLRLGMTTTDTDATAANIVTGDSLTSDITALPTFTEQASPTPAATNLTHSGTSTLTLSTESPTFATTGLTADAAVLFV